MRRLHVRLPVDSQHRRQAALGINWRFGRRVAPANRWGSAVFVAASARYCAIYSIFAILLLFLFWLHLGWVIVLLGSQVAYAHQHIHFFQGNRQLLAQSPAGREKLAVHLMLLSGRNFYHGLDALTVHELPTDLQIPAGIVKELLEMLAATRLLLPVADGETFVLGRDPETIRVKEILDCVRHSGQKIRLAGDRNEVEIEINDLLEDVDRSIAKALAGKNLPDMILKFSPPELRD